VRVCVGVGGWGVGTAHIVHNGVCFSQLVQDVWSELGRCDALDGSRHKPPPRKHDAVHSVAHTRDLAGDRERTHELAVCVCVCVVYVCKRAKVGD
jgi:hypothetical protein